MRLLLLFSLLLPIVVRGQILPKPWIQAWNLTADSHSPEYWDQHVILGSFSTEGVRITWSNPSCLPTAICIKRLLQPIPDESMWINNGHCSHPLFSYPYPIIQPRIGYYHIMVHRPQDKLANCDGTLTLTGNVCDEDRVYDGEHCELPATGLALRDLNKPAGVSLSPFVIRPQQGKPDVGHKTFLFNNDKPNAQTGKLWINASGILTLHGRYGAVSQISPTSVVQDFSYTMKTNNESIMDSHWYGMPVGESPSDPNNTLSSAPYGFLEYITLINDGNTNITVYNLSASIQECPPRRYGKNCEPRYEKNVVTTGKYNEKFFLDIDKDATFKFVPIDIDDSTSRVRLLVQNVPADDNSRRTLPDLYIRQRAIPVPGTDDSLYDIKIEAKDQKRIYYDFGELDTRPGGRENWYIAFKAPDGKPLTPIALSLQQDCAAECTSSGSCVDHICKCNSGFTYYDCSIEYTPSDEIELPSGWRYSLFTLAMVAPIFMFFILKRHLNNLVTRPSLASQGLGMGPGHVLGGSDIQDGRRWQ